MAPQSSSRMSRTAELPALLASYPFVLLDGGLATELERAGHDLSDKLWSARLLRDEPEAIRRVHRDYLEAGADCIVSASYQASVAGFVESGRSRRQAEQLIGLSLTLAQEARDAFAATDGGRRLVAASIGPYGAYLADGSEYRGDYGVESATLRAFHQPRWEILAQPGTLLACETIPSRQEAELLLELLAESPGVSAWLSFSCRDGAQLADGTPIEQCARLCAASSKVVAVGVNCTAPRFLPELLRRMHTAAPGLPLVAYPNSGETYDVESKCWHGTADPASFASAARQWVDEGARVVGGCCRTGPGHIRALAALRDELGE